MIKNLFSASGRMPRSHYFLITVVGFIFIPASCIFFVSAPNTASFVKIKVIMMFCLLIYGIFYTIISKIATIKRLHDLGQNGENIWMLSIPIKNYSLTLSLLFEKGQMSDNEYGPTTWTEQELEKIKPDKLKKAVNRLGVKNFNKKKNETLPKHTSDKNVNL